ncbi:MAG: DUF4214 domain-containing protein [Acidimicrobiia bacterium]|nr:DUF4214 domain-containing protein [Acidimicrobiia bacterium]
MHPQHERHDDENPQKRGWLRTLVVVSIVAVIATLSVGITAAAPNSRPSDPVGAEAQFFSMLNAERARAGRAPLAYDANLVRDARNWSNTMAPQNRIFHTSTLGADTARSVANWRRAGENVGRGWGLEELHQGFVNSPSHYSNIVGDYTQVGVGVTYTGDRTYVTFRFAKGATPPAVVVGTSAPVVSTSEATAQVRRLYLAFFERQPDASGSGHWVGQLINGLPLGAVSQEFVKSQEFRSTYGSLSNDQFVSVVYRNVLDRGADADGHAYWTDKLNRGMSRGGVMVNFSESAEFIATTR